MGSDPLEGRKLARERKTHQAMPEWDSPGMDKMEEALHMLDEEAYENSEKVGHLLLCLARLEHINIVAQQSVKKHLPEHIQQTLPEPEKFYNRESLKEKILEEQRDLEPEGEKKCTKCGKIKKMYDFGKASRNKDGRDHACRDCEKEYRRSMREKQA